MWPQPLWLHRCGAPGIRGPFTILACVASAFVASSACVAWPRWSVRLSACGASASVASFSVCRLASVALLNFWPVWPQPPWLTWRVSPGLRGIVKPVSASVASLACVALPSCALFGLWQRHSWIHWRSSPGLGGLVKLWRVWPQPLWLHRSASPGLGGLVKLLPAWPQPLGPPWSASPVLRGLVKLLACVASASMASLACVALPSWPC